MLSFRLTSRRSKAISAFLGVLLSFDAAYAASGWVVGLSSSSQGGAAKAATVTDLTLTAVVSPTITGLLYPGGVGDVDLEITNPNSFPVTISDLVLPPSTPYATGYDSSGVSGSASSTGTSTTSEVSWTKSASTTTTVTLGTPINVAGGASYTVTLTGEASMGSTSDSTCEGVYFVLPSLSNITALAGGTSTSGPSTDTYS